MISRTPEILKLKIAFTSFEFKKIETITLNTLKLKIVELKLEITELTNKVQYQSEKNISHENLMR